jgi:mono/diheme cytochrome c family protein
MRRSLLFIALALLVAGGSASADGHGRASALFDAKCARCHVVGWGKEAAQLPPHLVDLTLSATKHDEGWLRAWLRQPLQLKAKTQCRTDGLDTAQIESLLAFLQTHAKPMSRQIAIPKAQHRPSPLDESGGAGNAAGMTGASSPGGAK